MRAKDAYRSRDETQVAILDALADHQETGMTVFELRAKVDENIDTLEDALSELKADDLIEVKNEDGRTVIFPKEHVVGNGYENDEESFFDQIRRRFPF
jgi:predicted transcriptional regulator